MSMTSRFKSLAVLIATPLALLMANGTARAVTFSAPLVECSGTVPAAMVSTCASSQDPLIRGTGSINDVGDVSVSVTGAGAQEPYAVVFRSPDGTKSVPIGNFTTDNSGNGHLKVPAHFQPVGTTGAGIIVLTRGGDQYVSGLAVPADPTHAGPDFNPGLVQCAAVTQPAPLSNCGKDPLKNGSANIMGDDGALTIFVHGAAAVASYTAVLRSSSGTELTFGTVGPTDKKGNGSLIKSDVIAAGTTASGTIVLKSNSNGDEYMSGFKVTAKPPVPTDVLSDLVSCQTVTDGVVLANCGTDPLTSGTSEIKTSGQIRIVLTGAEPSLAGTGSYEVFFRPLDNSGDVDTGLALSTDVNGNVTSKLFQAFPSGTVGSGSLVIRREGFDQFVTGFIVK